VVWVEKQRPETKQKSIQWREIGWALSGAAHYQELLFHQPAVSDDRLRPTWPKESGNGRKYMGDEYQ